MNKRLLHASWLLGVLLATGCAALPPERDAQVDEPDRAPITSPLPELEPEVVVPAPDPAPDRTPDRAAPAVIALLSQADEASGAGQNDRAASLLERALRIDPQNPALWHNLAVVHYREGDYAQAESMAMRSNRYANGRRPLMARNWELIAISRELAGNEKGAEEARLRARALSDGVRS